MRQALLLTLTLGGSLFGQDRCPDHISFDMIGVNEGLPHANVSCLLEDDRGGLWVGMAEGLAVYHGKAFEVVDLAGSGEPLSVRGMTKDRHGIIWIAAEQGPVRLDPVTREAVLLPFPDSLKQNVKVVRFNAVEPAGRGRILFANHYGTYFYDPAQGSFHTLRAADGAHVRTYWRELRWDQDRQGIWITARDQGLLFFDTLTSSLHAAPEPTVGVGGAFSPLLGHPLYALCPDGSGGRWSVNYAKGELWHWDGRSKEVTTYTHLPGVPDLMAADIGYLARDGAGHIWGSGRKGGFRWHPDTGCIVRFKRNADEVGALPLGSMTALYQGADGTIWLGNRMGIAIHDPARPQVRSFGPFEGTARDAARTYTSITFSGDTVLWFGLGGQGLRRVDLRSGALMDVPMPHEGRGKVDVQDVLSLPDHLVVGTPDGVYTVDHRTLEVSPLVLRTTDGARADMQGGWWLADGADGHAWLATTTMLARFDPRTGLAQVHRPDDTVAGALIPDERYCGAATTDGRFWAGGNLYGLALWSPSTNTWKSFRQDLEQDRISLGSYADILALGDSLLWIASDGAGLMRYQVHSGTYTVYGSAHGFTELSLGSLGQDRLGRIWTMSEERVYCFDPAEERAFPVHLNSRTGGLAPIWTMGLSPGGLVGVNLGSDAVLFDGNTVGAVRTPPEPVLARVLVDGVAVDPGSARTMRMDHDRSQLELHFGAVLPPGTIAAYAVRSPGEPWSEYREGRVNLRGLMPGQHVFEFRLRSQQGLWGPSSTLRVVIPPPWWQTLVARIAFALALAAAIVLVFRARLNWVRRRERAQEEQARQLNELKLQALRAQMDPHFIFNCLNSIDSFIIANDREQASHYLGRFAKLIRLILQHSDSTRVPLEHEVEMLKYYLELEALRFKVPFSFAVQVDDELDGEPAELPTMLVQPYIENAIWHGLRHKDSPGHLRVDFKLHGDQLECLVEDDGIGREAARVINMQRSGVHRSMGMRVSADRLRLYGELEQGASRVTIQDLVDSNGRPAGTRVTILIPLLGSSDPEHPSA